MAGREGLAVEVSVTGHVQASQIDTCPDYLSVMRARRSKPAGCSSHVSPAGVRHDHNVRIAARQRTDIRCYFSTKCLDPHDAEGRVQRGIEVARLFENRQEEIEEFRPNGALNNL